MKSVLITTLMYESRRYCQEDFLNRLASIEVPEGYEVDVLIVVKTEDMVKHGKYYHEIVKLVQDMKFPATVAHFDVNPYAAVDETRMTVYYNILRGYRNTFEYDYIFNAASNVMVEPNSMAKLLKDIEQGTHIAVAGGCVVGDDEGIRVHKKLPLGEFDLCYADHPLPVTLGDKTGWISINLPVIKDDGKKTSYHLYEQEDLKLCTAAFPVDGVSLECAVIRGDVFDRIGFKSDRNLQHGVEENFCIDVRKIGYGVFCDPFVHPLTQPPRTANKLLPETEATLSIVVPTIDPQRPLDRLLQSIQKQPLGPDDEVIVVVDTNGGGDNVAKIQEVVHHYGPQYRVVGYDAGHHCWGHCQINRGFSVATKKWVTYNDDDDIYAPGAFEAIREKIRSLPEPHPIIFKIKKYGETIWRAKGWGTGEIDGKMMVAPNNKLLGRSTCRYSGDFDWVMNTVQNYDMEMSWATPVIAITRPKTKDYPENWK